MWLMVLIIAVLGGDRWRELEKKLLSGSCLKETREKKTPYAVVQGMGGSVGKLASPAILDLESPAITAHPQRG